MISSIYWKTLCIMEEKGGKSNKKTIKKIQMEQGDGEDVMIIGDIQELVPTNLALIGFQRKVKRSKESRMLLLFLLEDDAFLENKNTDGKQVLSQDDISCPGPEFEVPVEYPSRDLDILFWNGE